MTYVGYTSFAPLGFSCKINIIFLAYCSGTQKWTSMKNHNRLLVGPIIFYYTPLNTLNKTKWLGKKFSDVRSKLNYCK